MNEKKKKDLLTNKGRGWSGGGTSADDFISNRYWLGPTQSNTLISVLACRRLL